MNVAPEEWPKLNSGSNPEGTEKWDSSGPGLESSLGWQPWGKHSLS